MQLDNRKRLKRIETKLPSLLVDRNVSDNESKNNYNVANYRLGKLKQRNPQTYNTLLCNMEKLVRQFDVESKNILERAHKLYADKRACNNYIFFLFMKPSNAVYNVDSTVFYTCHTLIT